MSQSTKKEDNKTQFFLTASHQLKSPIAIIQWCLQSVMELSDLDDQAKNYVQKSLVQADAMSALIGDMLHVFRLMRHQDGPDTYTIIDLNKLIAQIMDQYTLVAERKVVRLISGKMEVLPNLPANEAYLKQAFINIVDNAIKYTLEGGAVTVSATTKNNIIVFEVEDQGIGISDADQSKLFTEFFRSQAAQDLTHEGTGLGLVVVKHVVEDLGGTVDVVSKLGRGTKFTLKIPFK